MARRATSLGPKPSLFVFFFCFLFFVFFFLFSFFLLPFLSLFLIEKTLFFPLKRAFFGLFSLFPFLSPLTFFGLPLFHFLFLCLSVLLLSFFLPSCLSFLAFFVFLVFVSFFVLSSVLLFLEKNNMKILNWNSFSSSKCSLFGVSCLVFSLKSLFLIFVFFSWFWVMFFVQHHCFWFQKTQVEKHIFSKKRGVATKRGFFYEPVFCKMSKVIVFFGIFFFLHFLGCFSKNTIKIGILAHFSKQKITKKWHFWKLLSGPSWKILSGPSWLHLKKRQLGPDNNFQIFCAQFFFPKKKGWNPYLYSVFWQSEF